jgi:hypothetical protein
LWERLPDSPIFIVHAAMLHSLPPSQHTCC